MDPYNIYTAIDSGDLDLVELLVTEENKYEAFSYAIELGAKEVIRLLIRLGFHRTEDVIELAFECGTLTVELVDCFVEANLPLDLYRVLYYAAQDSNFELVNEMMTVHRLDVTPGNVITGAIISGNVEMVDYFWRIGAYWDEKAPIYAAEYGNLEMLQYIDYRGGNVHVDNDSPLRIALTKGQYHIADYLLSMGANINANDGSAIVFAARRGDLQTVQYIVKNGGRPDIRNNAALHEALKIKNGRVARFLILHCNCRVDHPSVQRYIDAANKISQWWVPICYDHRRPVGMRMFWRNYNDSARVAGWTLPTEAEKRETEENFYRSL